MAKFEIGEIAEFLSEGEHESDYGWIECEIISVEYNYNGRIGYDFILPNLICPRLDSKNGEWFEETKYFRKKQQKRKNQDVEETKAKGCGDWPFLKELLFNKEKENEKV